jgi:hypothetical protein
MYEYVIEPRQLGIHAPGFTDEQGKPYSHISTKY